MCLFGVCLSRYIFFVLRWQTASSGLALIINGQLIPLTIIGIAGFWLYEFQFGEALE